MNQSSPSTTQASTKVAVISAAWHADIVNQARDAATVALEQAGVVVEHFSVPGAYEIPLHAKLLARTGRFDAIIACGLVVDGGIYRHEFVASATIEGLMSVQLETDVPMFTVVLTPHHFHEHGVHQTFFREHFVQKGQEAAQACQQTLASLRTITG